MSLVMQKAAKDDEVFDWGSQYDPFNIINYNKSYH